MKFPFTEMGWPARGAGWDRDMGNSYLDWTYYTRDAC